VTALLAGVAAGAAVAGAVAAVSSRDPRTATIGLLVTLLGLAFVAEPPPPLPALAVRLVAGILAGYLLWVVVRETATSTSGSPLAWPTETVLALTGAVIGWTSHGLGAPGRGPAVASALGLALLVLAAAPVIFARNDVFRTGVGLTLLLAGAVSIRVGLAGTPGPVEQVVLAGLTAGLGAAVALLVRADLAGRDGRGRRIAAVGRRIAAVGPAELGDPEWPGDPDGRSGDPAEGPGGRERRRS
jgi:hypothetical protein